MSIANKTSLRVPHQLPEFIRSDDNFQTFVSFLQAYYEWMEQQNIGSGKEGAIYGTQSLLNYTDVDYREDGETYNKFIDYYFNDFLPNFPADTLADKSKLIKIARELYSTKGTPASYQFLFRALYNSDAEIFPTRDVILKASDGKWYVSKSLKLDTIDDNFLAIDNLRLFGETSKSFATVERSIRTGTKTEVYISNIERLFQSGENVRVIDNRNQTVYFKNGQIVPEGTIGATPLVAKIIGSISSVQINSAKRGQLYNGRTSTYSGDPVVFYGGLNSDTAPHATAYVNEVTSGSIRDINVINGAYGFREDPNTIIRFVGGGGSGAIANVSAVDPAGEVDVAFIPQNYLISKSFLDTKTIGGPYDFFEANSSATINCSLANAFTFTGFATYPLTAVTVNNGGGGYKSVPAVFADSIYDTLGSTLGYLASLGILGPIRITTPGTGYANGDIIAFTDSAGGVGAHAYVNVNATGSIVSATYTYSNTANHVTRYPLGGLGYRNDKLPTLIIQTSGGSGAVLNVTNVLGAGAQLEAVPDERGIGAITSFIIENYGEDYIGAPNVSLKVRDLAVSNISPSNLPKRGDTIYQGNSINDYVFKANVDSITVLVPGVDTLNTLYALRTYNYTSNTKTDLQLKLTDRVSGANIYPILDTGYETFDSSGNYLYKSGIRTYGNGAAQATAKFLNGLIIGEGQYLKDDGFPSSFQVLESQDYNNFTYDLTVQKSFDAYKDALFKLLHPSGTKIVPINALKSSASIRVTSTTDESNSEPLSFYTGTAGSNATIYATFANPSNNVIKFDGLASANLANIISVNTFISVANTHGPNVYSKVTSVDYVSNTATISENVFLRYANVAYANTTTSCTKINITGVTDQYEIINNGEWSNTEYKIHDLAFIGDQIRVYANATHDYVGTVTYVSYGNNTIFVTPAPSFNAEDANVWIGRNLVSTNVNIYNNLGIPGQPALQTQSGDIIITQSGAAITLGI